MDMLLNVGLSNAVAAVALAVIAAVAGYFCRRPAVRHALWLLVLLKLVTPPLIDVHLPWPAEPPAATVVEVSAPPAEEWINVAGEVEAGAALADLGVPPDVEEVPAEPAPEEPAAAPSGAARDASPEVPVIPWRPAAVAAWLAGAVAWLALAALRARRFARLLRYAQPAPAWLRREANGLARRLGLAGAPAIGVLPGRVSPMLWSAGWGARLLLPADLIARLDADGRRTLLAHELAHLRRRDHRLRLFELLVTALFWWHPVVWWARRELREAEEQCCDAWVLWALPASAKAYALALVETVDFLSEAPAALPALASGVGHVRDLRRRVTMIMQGTTPRALTWGGLLTLFGLGAFLLPVMPTWAQEEPGQPIRLFVKDVEVKAEDVKKSVQEGQDLAQLKAELEKKRAELAQLEAKLKAAQERLSKAGTGEKKDERKRIVIEIVGDDGKRQTLTLPEGGHVIGGEAGAAKEKATAAAQAELARARAMLEKQVAELRLKARGQAQGEGKGIVIEIVSDGKRQVIQLPPGSRVLSGGGEAKEMQYRLMKSGEIINKVGPVPPAVVAPPAQPRFEVKPVTPPSAPDTATQKGIIYLKKSMEGDTDKRIADLEKKLDELTRAVKELHGDLNKGKPGSPLLLPKRPGGGPAPLSPPDAPLPPAPPAIP